MSTRPFVQSVYFAWDLALVAVLVLVFLAASPPPMTIASEGSGPAEAVSAAVTPPSRAEATGHDPSVPAASSVEFAMGDGSEPVIASF